MNNIKFDDIVRKYNLSPIEIIMLSFDLARFRKDNCYLIFENLLKSYDINAVTYRLYGNRIAHSRSAIHVKDDKYNIDGIYFFDLSWSLKKDEDDEKYKYIYNYFAKTKSYFDVIDKNVGLEDFFIGNFSEIADSFYDVALFDNYNEVSSNDIDAINNVSEIYDEELLNLPYECDKTQEEIYEIYKTINQYDLKLDKTIPGEVFIELLLEITKIKYLEGISDDFNLDYLKYVFYNSDWAFSEKSVYNRFRNNNYENDNAKFLANIYNIENIDTIFKTIDFYSQETGLETRIQSIKNDDNVKKIKIV